MTAFHLLTRALVACSLVATALSGCTPRDDDRQDDALTMSAFSSQSVKKLCDVYVACGVVGASQCETALSSTFERIAQAIDDGRTKFDASKAKACLDSLADLTCDDELLDSAACNQLWVPQVPAGGDCYGSEFECVDGFCAQGIDDEVCPGTCRAFVAAGGSCADRQDRCVDGTWCGMEDTCVALAREGERCDYETPCDWDLDLSCKREGSAGEGRCQRPQPAGSACTEDSECVDGLYCQIGADDAKGSCRAKAPRGGACDVYADSCLSGLYCVESSRGSDTGTCEQLKAEGAKCVPGMYECASPLRCSVEGRCVGRAAPGAECGYASGEFIRCADGYCEMDENYVGICQPLKKAGEACFHFDECGAGLQCNEDSGKCEAPQVCAPSTGD